MDHFLDVSPPRGVAANNGRRVDNITRSKDSNPRLAASIGLGVFFGIAPLWGLYAQDDQLPQRGRHRGV
ncbi:hypothetical protein, partial [Bilophila wadsworthia]|uniref:hypothetical protein n=1 Tax=Bilophila wadsworthia TaxID=35833 RepID=UPI003AB35BAE